MNKIYSWVVKAGYFIINAHLGYMLRYARKKKKYPYIVRYNKAKQTITRVLRVINADISGEGLENYLNLKEKSVLISNHLSAADPLIYISSFNKPTTFAAKIETKKYPFIKTYLKALDVVCLDRGHLLEQQRSIVKMIRLIKDIDEPNFIIFAEGTRNHNIKEGTLEFKPGVMKIAYKAGVPIIPIAIYGTQRILKKEIKLKTYFIQFKVFKPIMPSVYQNEKTTELAPKVEKMINDEILKMKKRDIEYYKNVKMSEKTRSLLLDDDYPATKDS